MSCRLYEGEGHCFVCVSLTVSGYFAHFQSICRLLYVWLTYLQAQPYLLHNLLLVHNILSLD